MPSNWREELVTAWEASGPHPNLIQTFQNQDYPYYLYPYLECTNENFVVHTIRRFPWLRILKIVNTVPPNKQCQVGFQVQNLGSLPSWTCIVEVWEKPGDKVLASRTISLQPYQNKEISFRVQAGASNTRMIAVVYDPMFDPLDMDNISNRKSAPLAVVLSRQLAPPSLSSRGSRDYNRTVNNFINLDEYDL